MATVESAAVAADRSAAAGQAAEAARARLMADFWRISARVTALLDQSGAVLDEIDEYDRAAAAAADDIPY